MSGAHLHRLLSLAVLGALALLIGITYQSVTVPRKGPVPTPRRATPHVGEACRSLRSYPVTFVRSVSGNLLAMFAFAGGAAHGSQPVSDEDARMIPDHDAYVTDAQLGSYQHAPRADARSELVCRLDPTFHFYCPLTNALDQLCYTWVTHGSVKSPSSKRPDGLMVWTLVVSRSREGLLLQ